MVRPGGGFACRCHGPSGGHPCQFLPLPPC
jgi:hypothetical protein